MSISYSYNTQGVTLCQNASGLTFFMLGQSPYTQRSIISTGGLNRR